MPNIVTTDTEDENPVAKPAPYKIDTEGIEYYDDPGFYAKPVEGFENRHYL